MSLIAPIKPQRVKIPTEQGRKFYLEWQFINEKDGSVADFSGKKIEMSVQDKEVNPANTYFDISSQTGHITIHSDRIITQLSTDQMQTIDKGSYYYYIDLIDGQEREKLVEGEFIVT